MGLVLVGPNSGPIHLRWVRHGGGGLFAKRIIQHGGSCSTAPMTDQETNCVKKLIRHALQATRRLAKFAANRFKAVSSILHSLTVLAVSSRPTRPYLTACPTGVRSRAKISRLLQRRSGFSHCVRRMLQPDGQSLAKPGAVWRSHCSLGCLPVPRRR
jgi:hypothetical protein